MKWSAPYPNPMPDYISSSAEHIQQSYAPAPSQSARARMPWVIFVINALCMPWRVYIYSQKLCCSKKKKTDLFH